MDARPLISDAHVRMESGCTSKQGTDPAPPSLWWSNYIYHSDKARTSSTICLSASGSSERSWPPTARSVAMSAE